MAFKVEVAVHIIFTVLFVALLLGPAMMYQYFSRYKLPEQGNYFNASLHSAQQCTPVQYAGMCLGPLQACSGGGGGSTVWIDSSVDVASHEQLAARVTSLIGGGACGAASARFLCQYLFPLCDGNGTLYAPTYQECATLSEGVCSEEWRLAPAARITLPVCSSLSNTTSVCKSEGGNTSSGAPLLQPTPTCSRHYYFNGSFCLAQCGAWEQYTPTAGRGVVITELIAATFGCVTQLLLMALFIHQWRRMSKFPSVFMIYHTVCYFVIVIIVVINHSVPYTALFCSRKSVIETHETGPTAFCTVSGVVLQYFFVSMCWWWLFHISGIVWTLVFPYHAKLNVPRTRCLHGTLVAAGWLLPIPGVIAAMATGGYAIGRHPPLLCTTRDSSVFYYSVVLLSSGILAAGLSMLVVLYWTLYKHSRSLKRANSSTSLDKDRRTKRLLAVLTYYTLFGTLAITHQSLELGNAPRLLAAVEESFTCEAAGGGDGRDNCPTRYVDYSYPAFGGVVYLLMGLIPTANMVFVLPAWQLWKYCRGGERGSTKGVREMKSSNSSTADL